MTDGILIAKGRSKLVFSLYRQVHYSHWKRKLNNSPKVGYSVLAFCSDCFLDDLLVLLISILCLHQFYNKYIHHSLELIFIKILNLAPINSKTTQSSYRLLRVYPLFPFKWSKLGTSSSPTPAALVLASSFPSHFNMTFTIMELLWSSGLYSLRG